MDIRLVPLLTFTGLALSMLFSVLIIRWIIKMSLTTDTLVGIDIHKKTRPRVPDSGGMGPLLSVIFSMLTIIFLVTIFDETYLYSQGIIFLIIGLLSVATAGMIGMIDDIFNIKWRYKILLGFLPSLPLMIFRSGTPTVNIPFLGIINFGILYSLVIVPLAVNFAFNSYNMLAGFNGLETGLGIISAVTVIVFTILKGAQINNSNEILIFMACLLGGLIALLMFNKYPAKTFVGDTGTLMIGTALIVPIILGNMETLAIGIFAIYFINFVLFFVYLLKSPKPRQKFANIDDQEYLIPPCPWTVYWFFPYFYKMKEQTNVTILWIIHALICLITVIYLIVL